MTTWYIKTSQMADKDMKDKRPPWYVGRIRLLQFRRPVKPGTILQSKNSAFTRPQRTSRERWSPLLGFQELNNLSVSCATLIHWYSTVLKEFVWRWSGEKWISKEFESYHPVTLVHTWIRHVHHCRADDTKGQALAETQRGNNLRLMCCKIWFDSSLSLLS
jgi:hypothetical protein